MRAITEIRDDIDRCDRVRPHLRDLGDLADLDQQRASYELELVTAEQEAA
jgi:hypothetical protein